MPWPRLPAEVLPLLTTISPLIGVASLLFISRFKSDFNAPLVRPMALSNSAMTLVLAIATVAMHEPAGIGDPAKDRIRIAPGINWLADSAPNAATDPVTEQRNGPAERGMGVRISLVADGLSVWSALLLSVTVCAVLCNSGRMESTSLLPLCIGLMTSQSLLVASCFVTDAIATLVFLEMALLPICFLIGTGGDDDRRSVAGTWWLWQMIGCGSSLLGVTLLAVSQPWMQSDLVRARGPALFDTSLLAGSLRQSLVQSEAAWHLWDRLAPWGAALLLLGLLIRLPVFPFLGWYQSTLAAAPARVAAVIAAAFPPAAFCAWLRLGVPSFAGDGIVAGILGTASLAGVLQAAFSIRKQADLKRIMATLSCAMLCLAGIGLSFQRGDGIRGACLIVLSQGLSVAAGMLLVQNLESRYGTRDLARLPDVVRRSPRLAVVLMILLLGFVGILMTSVFPAVYLQLWASSGRNAWMIAGMSVALAGVALTALHAFATALTKSPQSTLTPETIPASEPHSDIGGSELAAVIPILVLLLALNVVPTVVLRNCEPTIQKLLRHTEQRSIETTHRQSGLGVADAAETTALETTAFVETTAVDEGDGSTP
jgi:NADH-quinone oxidoreductase subunit M